MQLDLLEQPASLLRFQCSACRRKPRQLAGGAAGAGVGGERGVAQPVRVGDPQLCTPSPSSAAVECRRIRGVSTPRDVQRRLTQQGADVDALYEISARIEGKVDALDGRVSGLDAKVDQLAESTNARFDAVDARFDALEQRTDARFDAVDARFDALESTLAQILERLDRD